MKTNSFLFLAAATSMMLAACSKDNGQVIDDGVIRLSTANVISETKTTTADLQSEQFENNEQVGIFLVEDVSGTATPTGTNVTSYTQPLTYTANGSGGLTPSSTQYWPTSGNGLHIYGVYPMTAATTAGTYNATNVSFSVAEDQSSDANYKASDLMVGKPSSNPVTRTATNVAGVQLTFTHLLTKVNINLTTGDGFSADDLTSAEVYILNTKPTTTFSVSGQSIGDASGDAKEIKVCTGTTGSAIIVPQTVAANTNFIKIKIGGGEYIYKLTYDTGSAQPFKGSSVYTYDITVNKTGLTVGSTITGWTSVGSTTTGTATLQ